MSSVCIQLGRAFLFTVTGNDLAEQHKRRPESLHVVPVLQGKLAQVTVLSRQCRVRSNRRDLGLYIHFYRKWVNGVSFTLNQQKFIKYLSGARADSVNPFAHFILSCPQNTRPLRSTFLHPTQGRSCAHLDSLQGLYRKTINHISFLSAVIIFIEVEFSDLCVVCLLQQRTG